VSDVPPMRSKEVARYWAQSQVMDLCCQRKGQSQMTHNGVRVDPEDQVHAGNTSFNTMGMPDKHKKLNGINAHHGRLSCDGQFRLSAILNV
jgi:hypothetical protein